MSGTERPRPPFPPFDKQSTAQKVRMAEDAWNTRDPHKSGSQRTWAVTTSPAAIATWLLPLLQQHIHRAAAAVERTGGAEGDDGFDAPQADVDDVF